MIGGGSIPLRPDIRSWLRWLVFGLPLLALLITLWPALHFVWTQRDTYSHGYLVLGIAAWLCLRELRRAPVRLGAPSLVGLGALALVVAAAVVCQAADVALFVQLAIPAIVFSALWAAVGWGTAKRFLLPAAYLIFAMPVWDIINDLLRELTVLVVGEWTQAASIPAYIDEFLIRIPSGTFEVAGGCSGLHFLIVGSALGTLYGVVTFDGWFLRAVMLALSVVLALVANWIRVFTVIVAGHLTEMQHYLVTVDHYYFGWAVFMVTFCIMFAVGHYLGRRESADGGSGFASEEAAAASAPQMQPYVGRVDWRIALGAVLLSAGAWLSFSAASRPVGSEVGSVALLPDSLGGWELYGEWDGTSRPRFVNSDRAGSGRFLRGDRRVNVYTATYSVQSQGREIVYYANLPEGEHGQVLGRSSAKVELSDGGRATFAELQVATSGNERRLIWYTYQVAGMRTGSAAIAKLLQVVGGIRGRWDAQVIVMSSPCDAGDCSDARRTLEAFAADAAAPALAAIVSGTAHGGS